MDGFKFRLGGTTYASAPTQPAHGKFSKAMDTDRADPKTGSKKHSERKRRSTSDVRNRFLAIVELRKAVVSRYRQLLFLDRHHREQRWPLPVVLLGERHEMAISRETSAGDIVERILGNDRGREEPESVDETLLARELNIVSVNDRTLI